MIQYIGGSEGKKMQEVLTHTHIVAFNKFFQTVPGGRLCQRHQGTLHDLLPTSAVLASSTENRNSKNSKNPKNSNNPNDFDGCFCWIGPILWGCIVPVSKIVYLLDFKDPWLKILRSVFCLHLDCSSNCSSSLQVIYIYIFAHS